MCDLKETLDAGGHCILEMPSGTGKTVSLLSLIVSYMQVSRDREQSLSTAFRLTSQFYPTKRKLIYCSRTVPEIEKALAELKRLMEYRAEMGAHDEEFRGLGLTSRKNTCLHPEVSMVSLRSARGGTMSESGSRSAGRRRARWWTRGVET